MTEREILIKAYEQIDLVPISEMATILNRDARTIANWYPEAIVKRKGKDFIQKSKIGKDQAA